MGTPEDDSGADQIKTCSRCSQSTLQGGNLPVVLDVDTGGYVCVDCRAPNSCRPHSSIAEKQSQRDTWRMVSPSEIVEHRAEQCRAEYHPEGLRETWCCMLNVGHAGRHAHADPAWTVT